MTEISIVKEILIDYFVGQKELVEKTLEKLKPEELKTDQNYFLSKINTEKTEGPNGIYEKATEEKNQNNPDFKALVKDLEKHDGKLTKNDVFIWLFNSTNQIVIGMKPTK